MDTRRLIVALLVAGSLAGCRRSAEALPWHQRDIPVTPPIQMRDADAQVELPADPQKADAAWGPDAAVDTKHPTAGTVTNAQINEPTMVENLVNGVESPTGPQTMPALEPAEPASSSSAPYPAGSPAGAATAPWAGLTQPKGSSPKELVVPSLIQVNDRFLTIEDVLRASYERLAELPDSISRQAFRSQAEQIIRQETENLIHESLAYAQAAKRLTEQHKELVEDELNRLLRAKTAEAGGGQKKLEAALAQRGTDLKTFLEDQRRQLTIRLHFETRLYPAITISRQELWDYYRVHGDDFSDPPKVQMQVIAAPYDKFLADSPGEPTAEDRRQAAEQAKAVITQAAEAIQAGEDFAQVARRLSRDVKASNGGTWPMMPAGSFREKEVEAAAFALKQGQVSQIIQTESGYYIVKARSVQPGRKTGFEEAQEQIERDLRNQKFDKLLQDDVQRLAAGAYIQRPQEFLKLAVDRAVEAHWRR